MDAVYASPLGRGVPLKEKPNFYFQRQCWISCDPDERSLVGVIPLVGERRFLWASDYPHPDHPPEYVKELAELVELLPSTARWPLLGDSVREAYGLPPRPQAGARPPPRPPAPPRPPPRAPTPPAGA